PGTPFGDLPESGGATKKPTGTPARGPREEAVALAAAAADGGVVHQQAAGAARLEHGVQAVAAGLDHFAALRVAAGAGDAAAVLGHLALAHAHGQVAAVDHHAVERA